jgi:hypothetical protein
MTNKLEIFLRYIFILGILITNKQIFAQATNKYYAQKQLYRQFINNNYPEQLTSPEKKKRKSFSQFGYGLSFFAFPLFPITDFMDPDNFGEHSYGKPDVREKNGSLYTCKGGFIDFSHIRVAADWTVFLTFKLITEEKDTELPSSDGVLKLHLNNISNLPVDDIISIAQKIAFERLVWHELASWYYHLPNYTFNEQQSTFTPEDTYSNFFGTIIGRNIALRILQKQEALSYAQIASEEIQKQIAKLEPVTSKKQSMEAYDIVDAAKQSRLPQAQQNKDVWWDSKVLFRDQRYVFKRYINIGPQLNPWLVPKAELIGCAAVKPQVLYVPQKTKAGNSLYNYYTLTIIPDSLLFYDKRSNIELHKPFGTFTTKNMHKIIDHVSKEMQKELLGDFNKRNKKNPEKNYKKLRKVWFRKRAGK